MRAGTDLLRLIVMHGVHDLLNWSPIDGENSDVVMETGIYDLTEDQCTALVHFGADKSQSWVMVRLDEPEEES